MKQRCDQRIEIRSKLEQARKMFRRKKQFVKRSDLKCKGQDAVYPMQCVLFPYLVTKAGRLTPPRKNE